jgi:Membrane bound O-acyl transferase family
VNNVSLLIYSTIFTLPLWGYLVLNYINIYATILGWIFAIILNVSIYLMVDAAPLGLMFLYIISTFWSLKIVVANNQLKKSEQLNFLQWLFFCCAWFGMNPSVFKKFPNKALPKSVYYCVFGLSRIIVGVILINIAYNFLNNTSSSFYYLQYTAYLIGVSFILHFGILNINTGLLRMVGVNVFPLFNNPIKSKSLQEFWSKRWNMAFVELTTIAVMRPAKKVFSQRLAIVISYIFSGLLHELAISLPVNKGFGKPFLYFILQALIILFIEPKVIFKIKTKAAKLLWLLACVFTPIFILFHIKFREQIILPLIEYVVIKF